MQRPRNDSQQAGPSECAKEMLQQPRQREGEQNREKGRERRGHSVMFREDRCRRQPVNAPCAYSGQLPSSRRKNCGGYFLARLHLMTGLTTLVQPCRSSLCPFGKYSERAANLSVRRRQASRNRPTSCASLDDWSCIAPAAALASSTSAAFCCVDSSSCATAWLICSMPAVCSCVAALISAMMSVTFLTLST